MAVAAALMAAAAPAAGSPAAALTMDVVGACPDAESVRRFLVEKGVGLPRIHSIGLGDIRPGADNETKQGRDQNRRVSIRLYAPAE